MITASYDRPDGRLFMPTVEMYGQTNASPSTAVYKETFLARLNNTGLPSYSPKPGFPEYPKCLIDSDFDVHKSKYFAIDGQPCGF